MTFFLFLQDASDNFLQDWFNLCLEVCATFLLKSWMINFKSWKHNRSERERKSKRKRKKGDGKLWQNGKIASYPFSTLSFSFRLCMSNFVFAFTQQTESHGCKTSKSINSWPKEIFLAFAWKLIANLTRSLPRDVYIRRKNDHAGGQGRIYTSNLNFVSTHLSKPGHWCRCCCMSPRCLLRHFVDRCLLSWALFIEKTVFLCFARFLSKWRETTLWMFPDATQAGTSCTFDGFRDDGDWGDSGFRPVESEGDGNDGGDWLGGKLVTGVPGEKKMTTLLVAVNEDLDVQTHNERSSLSRDRRYECTSIVASEILLVSCQENFKAGALRQNVGKITIIHLKDPRSFAKQGCTTRCTQLPPSFPTIPQQCHEVLFWNSFRQTCPSSVKQTTKTIIGNRLVESRFRWSV